MKFSLSWLKDHLDTDATVDEIAAKLTAIGLEIEGVENPAEDLAGFRVARVLTAEKHPDADKLQVLSVDSGDGQPLTVVCGAPNARAGLVGVLGLPGAVVPSNGMEMRKAAIRGVESNGMMCSARELDMGQDHDGIIELPSDAPVGTDYADYAGLDDPVFDVAITPNRPDCMGVYGIARDLAAAGLGTLKRLDAAPVAGDGPCPVDIRIEDRDGCPAFYARAIRGVTNGASPDWMQARLKSAGQRPISALVDITNYVMLTYGRPSHAYDLAKLSGAVTARRARDGETVTALNEKEYTLDDTMLVIADEAGVHDIAGIMGGEHSSCTDATTDILLEVAYFDPVCIALTGRKLNLSSDARSRFERGIDPGFVNDGLELLTRLILDICGGEASEVRHVGAPPAADKTVAFDPALTRSLGGMDVPEPTQRDILERLGFVVTETQDHWIVAVPGWRPDVDGAPDLVEEVIRIHGLDAIPSVALDRAEGVAQPTVTPEQARERRVRRAAAARGNHEAVTWSFLPIPAAQAFGDGEPWMLANPISEDMKAMRPSLIPGLLMAAQRNMARGADSVRLFEIGRRYLRGKGGASDERLTLGLVMAGEKSPRGWQAGKAQPFDAFDAKAEAVALLDAAGAPVENLQVMGEAGEQFHPGQSATLRLGPKNVLARFGTLHPRIAKQFDMGGAVMAVEIFLDAIPAKKGERRFTRASYAPPALQSVMRDFAFLVPDDVAAGDLVKAVRGADKRHIVDARIFDEFRGAGVAEGHKSIAVEVVLQPQRSSFTEDDLKAISDAIVAAAAKRSAILRG
ncbi:phenylalanine--tRNA ligase subunit beta [Croceicoccus hydrothermalis]|uniref:phenylalanine--tRNA ligase subunit beta n=1 Tax=Croceicoccus hydrothermalis TaxID=2867964 RepID=UPI001EFB986C|nr:phenylalanine--tRNA ligase subunit beta [Croceicoccus hydrothermalis]